MLSESKLNVLKQISGDLSRDEAIWAKRISCGYCRRVINYSRSATTGNEYYYTECCKENNAGLRYRNRKQQKTGHCTGRHRKEKRASGKAG